MYEDASRFLAELDADWAGLIAQVGHCTFQPRPEREPYDALIRAVAYQQLHARAGDAILNRLLALNGGQMPTPEQLLALDHDQLRHCGFSGRKLETLRVIAGAAESGQVPSRVRAERMSDEALIERLVSLKGIGRWTVEMLLIYTLERQDILPADDYGVRDGYRRLKARDNVPSPKEIQKVGTAWSPYRTIAAWYLWQVPR